MMTTSGGACLQLRSSPTTVLARGKAPERARVSKVAAARRKRQPRSISRQRPSGPSTRTVACEVAYHLRAEGKTDPNQG